MNSPLDPVLLGGRDQPAEEGLDLGGKTDDLEAVAGVEVFHAEGQGFFGLFELLAGHRTGGVQDQGHILEHNLALLGAQTGRGEQQERAVLCAGPVRQKIHPQLVLFRGEVEGEVGLPPGPGPPRSRPWRWWA